jgi:hypothetical protein
MFKNIPLWAAGMAILASSFALAAPDPKHPRPHGPSLAAHTPAKANKKPAARKPQPKPAHKMTPGMKMP